MTSTFRTSTALDKTDDRLPVETLPWPCLSCVGPLARFWTGTAKGPKENWVSGHHPPTVYYATKVAPQLDEDSILLKCYLTHFSISNTPPDSINSFSQSCFTRSIVYPSWAEFYDTVRGIGWTLNCFRLTCFILLKKYTYKRKDWWFPEAKWLGVSEMDEGGPKVKTSNYIINKSGNVTHSMVIIVNNNWIAYLKVAKWVDLKILVTRKKIFCNYGDGC